MRSPQSTWAVSALLLGATACSSPAQHSQAAEAAAIAPVSIRECLDRPETRDYLHALQAEVLSKWTLPPEVEGGNQVVLRLTIDAQGRVPKLRMVRGTSKLLALSALAAVRRAEPLSRPSGEAVCVTGIPITATFSNPYTDNPR